MTYLDLTRREAEDIVSGERIPGRADLCDVIELTTFLRASRDSEPAPPMRPDLVRQIDAAASGAN
jgi:hypothetical protein